MKAYLLDGPANSLVISHPGVYLYRHPIPRPIEFITPEDAVNAAMNAQPNMDVADYEFSGYASVGLNGKVQYMIYKFKGMEP